MKDSDIFYALTVEDVQNVAQESLKRRLSDAEVRKVIPLVEKHMSWHDVVDDAIYQVTFANR